jgi:malate dehydrogenase
MLTVAKQVTGFPRERVIGMSGCLDSSRFRSNIARMAKASLKDVNAIVMGAHTDKDMVPITSTATIGGVPIDKIFTKEELHTVVDNTKKGGAEITELIGTSAWMAPGAGVTAMVESILHNEGRIIPCSIELNGEFGIQDKSCLCVPVKLTRQGAEKVYEFNLSKEEQEAFSNAHKAYLEVKKVALSTIGS